VSDGLLVQLLAVSATAIMQPLDLLKIRRWLFLFMHGRRFTTPLQIKLKNASFSKMLRQYKNAKGYEG
jgi:hypothetical protein